MSNFDIAHFLETYIDFKESALSDRYITLSMIEPIIQQLNSSFNIEKIGLSYEERPIYSIQKGVGAIKVLIWSQMHGNESTGTKAIFDLFSYFERYPDQVKELLEKCTLVFVPMLNPDGAHAYTRLNAQKIDLNRDTIDLVAPESNVLRMVLNKVNPQFCFNLHDQRTIFSVGMDHQPATLSFLAPSVDVERTMTDGRKVTMNVIGRIFAQLSPFLSQQIGRYSDEFYPTATGDNFEKMGHHTILVEAGHYLNDYKREKVRSFNGLALILGFDAIANNSQNEYWKTYLQIPNNEKNYLDIIYKNVCFSDTDRKTDVGIVFKEELHDGAIRFVSVVEKTGDLSNMMANTIVDIKSKAYKNESVFLLEMEKNQKNV